MNGMVSFLFFSIISALNLACLRNSVSVLIRSLEWFDLMWVITMSFLSYLTLKELLVREFLHWDEEDDEEEP